MPRALVLFCHRWRWNGTRGSIQCEAHWSSTKLLCDPKGTAGSGKKHWTLPSLPVRDKFTFSTDHAALQWLKTLKTSEGQLARWLGRLEQYHYEIKLRPGCVHNNADSLSHRPCEPKCPHCSSIEGMVICQWLQVWGDSWTPKIGDSRNRGRMKTCGSPDWVDGNVPWVPQLARGATKDPRYQARVATVGHVTPGGWNVTAALGRHTRAAKLLGGAGAPCSEVRPTARATRLDHQRPHGRKKDLGQAEAALLLCGNETRCTEVVSGLQGVLRP